MVAAVHREHLALAGEDARHPDGVLDRVGAAVGEEDLVQIPWGNLCDAAAELAANIVGEGRCDRREATSLLLDSRNEVRMLVAQVEVDQLTREVEVGVALVVPERGAFAPRDRQWIDQRLRAPRVEHVAAIVGAHLGFGGSIGHTRGGCLDGR